MTLSHGHESCSGRIMQGRLRSATSDGDLAHIGVKTEWEIIDPLQFARTIPDATGDEFIELALERATIHVIGNITLEELIDTPLDELRAFFPAVATSKFYSRMRRFVVEVEIAGP